MKLIDGKLISSICSVQTLFDCDGRTQHAWHGTFVPRSASLYLVAVVAAEVVIVEQVFVEHAHVRLWLSTVLHCRYPCCLGVCCIRRRIHRFPLRPQEARRRRAPRLGARHAAVAEAPAERRVPLQLLVVPVASAAWATALVAHIVGN